MTAHRSTARSLVSIIALLILVSLACNAPIGEQPETAPEETLPAADLAPAAEASAPAADARPEQAAPEAQQPVEAAAAQPEAAAPVADEAPAGDVGFIFESPYPVGTAIQTPYWDARVLEFLRGEPAFQRILQDRPDLAPPPPGMEYVVVHMVIRNRFTDEFSKSVGLTDVFIAGDMRLRRPDGLTDVPAPEIVYTDTYSAEELDGWYDALVATGEGNLVLVWHPNDGTDEPARYLALEEGAAPSPLPDLTGITPNDLGLDPANPAPLGQTVVTPSWEAALVEVLRGNPAAELYQRLHEGNQVDEGMAPTLVKLRVRYLGDGQGQTHLNWGAFAAAVDAEQVYESPRYLIWNPYDPAWMHIGFLPGGQHEGWVMLQAPAGQAGIMLRFQPNPWDAARYLALEP